MQRLLFLVALFICLLSLPTSGRNNKPLRFVSPDSARLEDMFWTRVDNEFFLQDSTWHAVVPTTGKVSAHRLDALQREWQSAVNECALWGGTQQLPATGARQVEAAMQLFDSSVRLFLLTGRADCLDMAERCLYNGLRAGTDTALPQSLRRQVAQRLLAVPAMTYASRGNDVFTCFYLRSTVGVSNSHVKATILQNTSWPWVNDTFMSFRFSRPKQHMRLHLRIPAWLRSQVLPGNSLYAFMPQREYYELFLNGRAQTARQADGWLVIDRVWHTGDVLTLRMANPVRRVTTGGRRDQLSLQFGPFVYVADTATTKFYVRPTNAIGYEFQMGTRHAERLSTQAFMRPDPKPTDKGEATLGFIPYYIAALEHSKSLQLWLYITRP